MFPSRSRPQTWTQYVLKHHWNPTWSQRVLLPVYLNVASCSQRENVEGVSQPPSDDVIRELSRSLREALGVSLFGIDVIINNQTGQHAVIDINAFPGRCSPSSTEPVCALWSQLVIYTLSSSSDWDVFLWWPASHSVAFWSGSDVRFFFVLKYLLCDPDPVTASALNMPRVCVNIKGCK